jgi:non-specific protein-tyrosine kinase
MSTRLTGPLEAEVRAQVEPTPAQRLGGYLRRLRRRWPLVVILTAIVMLVAITVALGKSAQYQASATLYFPQRQTLDGLTIPGTVVPEATDTESQANTNLQLIKQQPVAQAVIDQLGLHTTEQQLLTHVLATAAANSELATVTVQEPSAQEAKAVANAFVDQYVRFRRNIDRAALDQAAQSLRAQLNAIPAAQRGSGQALALANRLTEVQVAQAVQTGGVQVVRHATRPTSASSGHVGSTAALGLALGLVFAIAVALGLDLLDRRLKDDEEIEAAFGLPVLASVPAEPTGHPRAPLGRVPAGGLALAGRLRATLSPAAQWLGAVLAGVRARTARRMSDGARARDGRPVRPATLSRAASGRVELRRAASANGAVNGARVRAPSGERQRLLALDQREAAGVLAANLRLSGLGDGTLLISGTGRDEGQARVALGLAQALAHYGEQVAVIEADPRAPVLARLLGIDGGPGVSAVLANPERLLDEMVEVDCETMRPVGTRGTSAPTFHVLPSGSPTVPSAIVLSTPAMRGLLEAVRSAVDIVLVPIASVNDSLLLAHRADGILLVARLGRTTKDSAARALRALRNADILQYGLVVTEAGAVARH